MSIRLNRDQIKLIAILFMTCNHIAHSLISYGTPFYIFMESIGYFTAITMCYFLVEGYYYTKSKSKYALRFLLFALIAQIPFSYLFSGLNMLFTLLFCFFIILINDKIKYWLPKIMLISLCFLFSMVSDWAIMAPTFTCIFIWMKKKEKIYKGFIIANIFCFLYFFLIHNHSALSFQNSVFLSLINMIGPILASICLVFFYNGKQSEHHNQFSKWFFYLYYPLHLYIIMFVSLYIK